MDGRNKETHQSTQQVRAKNFSAPISSCWQKPLSMWSPWAFVEAGQKTSPAVFKFMWFSLLQSFFYRT
jgi:hypothetical protein